MGGIGSGGTIQYPGVTITIASVTDANSPVDLDGRNISLYQAIIKAADYIGNYAAAAFIKDVTQRILTAEDVQKGSS